jgi:FlaA1/EpsC-like NDP-sugar epimerase
MGEATFDNSKNGKKRALIYGAGAGGQLAVQEIERNQDIGLVLIGFIDDDIRKQNKTFMGYPVLGGKDRLSEIIDRRRISEVVISFQNMDKRKLNSLKKDCSELNVNISCLKVFIN